LSAVSCGGFFLYGTPLIYTQDVEEAEYTVIEDNPSSIPLGEV
jgi:hypothetical protein